MVTIKTQFCVKMAYLLSHFKLISFSMNIYRGVFHEWSNFLIKIHMYGAKAKFLKSENAMSVERYNKL